VIERSEVNDWERLKLDYESTIKYYQNLADIRFKSLAFVPVISGAAIALLTRTSITHWNRFILASLGLIITLGITLYDQRNTQFYDAAIG
jgi:1,4-dihydroxy-2-naphthoate octaprenyltransferase